MYRRTFYAGVVLAGAATVLTGCGATSVGTSAVGQGSGNNSSQSPSAELASAVTALGNASSLTTSVQLGLTPSQVSSLALSGGRTLSSAQASAIAGVKVTVEESAPSGKTLAKGAKGTATALTVSDNGTNYLSIRTVNNTVYVQADVADLLTALGKTQVLAALQAGSAMLPAFVQAFVAGKWISLSQAGANQLVEILGITPAPSSSANVPTPLINALRRVVAKDITVTRTSAGPTDDLTISGNARTISKGLVSQLKALVPGSGIVLARLHPGSVPSRKLTVTAQVTGGALSEVSVNLDQLAGKNAVNVPLNVSITRGSTAITAPSGAVAVEVPALGSLLSGLGGPDGLRSLFDGMDGFGINS